MPAEIDDMVEGTRNMATEIDYSKKDASRHIVVETHDDKNSLRARVLRNLECVRAGKQILASEKSLISQSIASTNARLYRARAKKAQADDLDQVAEEEDWVPQCEVCETEIDNQYDLGLCDKISMQIASEQNLQIAYNQYRVEKGLEPVNWDENSRAEVQHSLALCLPCLLKCFKA